MSAPLTMPTEAREPQGDDRAERETASAVHPDEVHAGVQAALLPAVDATACAVDVPALQRQRPVRGPSVGSVSGDDSTQRAHASSDACCGSGSPTHAETDCPEVGTGQKSAMDQGKSPTGPACREASAVGAPTVPAPGPSGIASRSDVARLGARAEHADQLGQGRCPMSLLAPFIRRGK